MTSSSPSIVSNAALAVLALDQALDVLVEHRATQPARDHVDELPPVEQTADVGVVEEPLCAREPERGAGDDDRFGGRAALIARYTHQPAPTLEELIDRRASSSPCALDGLLRGRRGWRWRRP